MSLLLLHAIYKYDQVVPNFDLFVEHRQTNGGSKDCHSGINNAPRRFIFFFSFYLLLKVLVYMHVYSSCNTSQFFFSKNAFPNHHHRLFHNCLLLNRTLYTCDSLSLFLLKCEYFQHKFDEKNNQMDFDSLEVVLRVGEKQI